MHSQSIIIQQNKQRIANHTHSKKAKAPILRLRPTNHITISDLVYLLSDRNKTRARNHYLVIEVTGSFCNITTFVGSQLGSTFCPKSQTSDHQQSTVILTPHQRSPFSAASTSPSFCTLYTKCYVNLPADQHEPLEDTPPDPVRLSHHRQ